MTHFAATAPPPRIGTSPRMTLACALPRHLGHRPTRRTQEGL
jgi:hypothetical protein